LATILWIIRKLYKKSWDSRAPAVSNVLIFAFGWFFVNLGPTSGITPINALMYEHWLYLAIVGPLMAIMVLGDRLISGQAARKIAVCFVMGLAIVGGWLSVKRNTLWGNPIAFFEDILRYEPNSARVNNNLANHYASIGNLTKAEEHYWKAVESNDSFPQPYFNLGTLLMERNDIRGAIEVFEKAIKADPYFPNAYDQLSVIYAGQGNLVKAKEMIKKFIELQPINPAAYYNLALIEQVSGNHADARAAIQAGLRYAPEGSEVRSAMEKLMSSLK
jgi:Flp pilus assembly protein TadD